MNRLPNRGNYSEGLHGLPHMGEVIANYRIRAGWASQEAFAIVCGVDKQSVAYWENQRYLSDMDRRIFLCKLLNVPPALLGLTWYSLLDEDEMNKFTKARRNVGELLEENAYALYEDILTFAHTSNDKYSPAATYRFGKHQQELEQIVAQVPEIQKKDWQELLSRFYQHSTFIAQHHGKDAQALSFADKAVTIASELNDTELLGTSLYRRSRVYFIQGKYKSTKADIEGALDKTKKARSTTFKGSSYLLAAEINALYADGDEQLKNQCRLWQDEAAKILYKGKIEEDGTFLTFDLQAVHHERAKTLLRFALPHVTDDELLVHLKDTHKTANRKVLEDTHNALFTARNHLAESSFTKEMYLSITEAKAYLVAKDFEASATTAKKALKFAYKASSQQGVKDVKKLYFMLEQLELKNPYVVNLGVELGIFPKLSID